MRSPILCGGLVVGGGSGGFRGRARTARSGQKHEEYEGFGAHTRTTRQLLRSPKSYVHFSTSKRVARSKVGVPEGVTLVFSNPSTREKLCVRCEDPFYDGSQSNARRYCSTSCHDVARKEVGAAYRKERREHYNKLNAANQRRKKAERHRAIAEIKSVPCADCSGKYAPYVMDFDHRDPSLKKYEINYLLNKTGCPWSRLLTEIEKCDVVCVNCHRLRTWKPPKTHLDNRRKLLIELKSVPCADCEGSFHYCQLDFDHVRGEKIREVPLIKNRAGILAEAAKCEVVCANCHRERSQQAKQGQQRVEVPAEERVWQRRSAGDICTVVADIPRTQERSLR